MPYLTRNQATTHYEVTGAGPAIVFIHGMGLDLTLWDDYAADLAESFRVVRLDMIGHGQSTPLPEAWGLGEHTKQVADLLDHLGIAKATIVGFSLGGTVAQRFALDYPDKIAGLIVVASVYGRTDEEQSAVEARLRIVEAEGPQGVVAGALSRWFTPDFRARNPDVVENWRRRLSANEPRAYLNAYQIYTHGHQTFQHRLGEIRAPALVLTGDRDPGQNPRMARAMSAAIPGSDVTILPDVAHMLPLERPRLLKDAIRGFMTQVPQ
jgi:3-oxoadipate enol-lactonase